MDGFILLGLLLLGGYVLGVVGFFRAQSAHAEIQRLRRALAAQQAAPVPQPEAAPPASVPFVAEPASPEPRATESVTVVPPAVAKPQIDIEALLTMRWGVWLGSAALLLAGVFLVRYAVDQGLLGPGVRCFFAFLLGLALLAGAEWLKRQAGPDLPGPFRMDQAPAGLAAGGTAVLLGAAFGAGPFYDLLPPLLAFALMAAASFAGLAASLRYGPLAAAVGLIGGFATPALVATDNPSMPGLFAYLFVVSAAAHAVVRWTAWVWLGWATTIAGAVWICLAAGQGGTDIWAAAAFVPTAAALGLALLPTAALDRSTGRRLALVPFAVLGVAGLVLEAQVAGAAPRVALFLLSPVAVWRGITEPRLDRLPWVAALFGLLTLLLWALPAWHPTGEPVIAEGIVEAVLPGAWAPAVIVPLIQSAIVLAGFHAGVGLWRERREPNPLHWAALTGAVPVLTMAVAYAQIARFQPNTLWAFAALALAAGLTATSAQAAREKAPQRAGVHAAGAVAALSLGCAMLLQDHWLTLAIALFLPALAWIEARADLPPLRRVALAVAGLVLIRLLLNWYVLDYSFGRMVFANGLIAAYAAPAAGFAYAAYLFRQRADDLLVATLEAGAAAFATLFVALEIRHGFGAGQFGHAGTFNEAALHLLTLSVQARVYLYLAQRTGRPVLQWAWRIGGSIALGAGALLILFNPAFVGGRADIVTLLAAFLVPAAIAVHARLSLTDPNNRRALAIYAFAAGFVWLTLQIRQAFHAGNLGLGAVSVTDAELWCWSAGWLVYGIGSMVLGIRTGSRPLRLAALGVVALVCAKVFLVDMADLTGLWRVLSFLGLGLALIGLGAAHRRFVHTSGDTTADRPD
jgi:uncharacterized membrane protein